MEVDNAKRLFVGNLHPSVTESDLLTIFCKAGKVSRVDYVWHLSGPKRGQPQGFAFIEFENVSDAKHAIVLLNNKVLRGRRIAVNPSTAKEGIKKTTAADLLSLNISDRPTSNEITTRKRIRDIDEQIRKLQVFF